jgi:hypothetical protein
LHVSLLLTTDDGNRWLLHKLASTPPIHYTMFPANTPLSLPIIAAHARLQGQCMLLPSFPCSVLEGHALSDPSLAIDGLGALTPALCGRFSRRIYIHDVLQLCLGTEHRHFSVMDLCMHFAQKLLIEAGICTEVQLQQWEGWIEQVYQQFKHAAAAAAAAGAGADRRIQVTAVPAVASPLLQAGADEKEASATPAPAAPSQDLPAAFAALAVVAPPSAPSPVSRP